MSRKARSSTPTDLDLHIEERRQAGETQIGIATELGLSKSAIVARLKKMQRYRAGEQLLARDPLSIDGLAMTGQLSWPARNSLWERGAKRLSDLSEWSPAELYAPGLGVRAVQIITDLMARHQLELHPDRDVPIERELDWRRLASAAEGLPSRRAELRSMRARNVGNVVFVDFRGH